LKKERCSLAKRAFAAAASFKLITTIYSSFFFFFTTRAQSASVTNNEYTKQFTAIYFVQKLKSKLIRQLKPDWIHRLYGRIANFPLQNLFISFRRRNVLLKRFNLSLGIIKKNGL